MSREKITVYYEEIIKEEKVMNINWGKIVKVVVPVASVAVTAATSYLSNKELDDKVAKKVAEALEAKNSNKG